MSGVAKRAGRWPVLGLGVVLLLLAAFSISAAILSSRTVEQANRVRSVTAAYQNARFGVGQEESLERKYRLEPSPAVRALYRDAVDAVLASLRDVRKNGNSRDAATAGLVLRLHRPYLAAIGRMFAAVDRGDTPAVLRTDHTGVDPTFSRIESIVFAAAARSRGEASAAMAHAASVSDYLEAASPAVFAVGLLLVWLLWRIRRREQRTAEREMAERNALLAEQAERLRSTLEQRERAEGALADAHDRLRHAQRLEAVGKLAGGVAHDFNNLLQVILGYCSLLEARSEGEDARQLGEISGAALRGAELTQQLLAFGRRQVMHPRVWDVNEIVVGIEAMLARVLPPVIDFKAVPDGRELHARIDRGQLEQVLVNLVVNARDAMPDGGALTIFTEEIVLDEPVALEELELPAGPYVRVVVRDTGTGMDAATKAHAFEPFFTTKERGQGTGLGLATAYGIVRQSGGFISLDSAPGAGTEVDVWLPLSPEAPTEPRGQGDAEPARRPHDVEVVLLAEDEDDVRCVLGACLRDRGYRVLEARDGREALELLDTEHEIDLIVTDVAMPRLDGWSLISEVRRRDTRLPILVISGFEGDGTELRPADGCLERLAKPFRPADAAAAVERLATRIRSA